MKDWTNFTKSSRESSEGGSSPKVSSYLAVKLVDNWIALAVLMLVLVFTVISIFVDGSKPEGKELVTWLTHSAGLCLGVFLGLLKGAKI
jgi:hypothetical protein